jgi:hypothetical protein
MSGPSSIQLELQYTQRLLACLIYEIQVNIVEKVEKEDEDPPGEIFDRLGELAQHTPPAVISLVDYLRRNPPQERPGELYTYSFPFVEWRCSLPSP